MYLAWVLSTVWQLSTNRTTRAHNTSRVRFGKILITHFKCVLIKIFNKQKKWSQRRSNRWQRRRVLLHGNRAERQFTAALWLFLVVVIISGSTVPTISVWKYWRELQIWESVSDSIPSYFFRVIGSGMESFRRSRIHETQLSCSGGQSARN